MSSINDPLILDSHTIKEIVEDVRRKFVLHTENISFHFDRWGISIIIHAENTPFNLPEGPVDVRLHGDYLGYSRRDIV